MIEIHSDRLSAKLFEPEEGLAKGTRFDHSGYVFSVILDGKYNMTYAPENLFPENPGGHGAGFCSEITCSETFESAQAGDRFHKFGVGLLTKPDDKPYSFGRPYECSPYPVSYSSGTNTAEFVVMPEDCGGYSLSESKLLELYGNVMTVTYHFKNTGTKPMTLNEYCHNFVMLDGLVAAPGTRIELPTVSDQTGNNSKPGPDGSAPGNLIGTEYGFTFTDPTDSASVTDVAGSCIDGSKPFEWTIISDNSPVFLKEEVSFTPSSLVVFTRGESISPEVNNTFTLVPGESMEYTRKITFGVVGED